MTYLCCPLNQGASLILVMLITNVLADREIILSATDLCDDGANLVFDPHELSQPLLDDTGERQQTQSVARGSSVKHHHGEIHISHQPATVKENVHRHLKNKLKTQTKSVDHSIKMQNITLGLTPSKMCDIYCSRMVYVNPAKHRYLCVVSCIQPKNVHWCK